MSCYLRSRHGRRLDVVAVEVALEIEVGEGLINTDGEQSTERSIRLDVVLVLQVVGLHVVVHRLGDLGAAHQGAGGAAEERQQFLRHLSRALKDRRGALHLYTVLIHLHAAAALAGILHVTVDTLLQTLQLGLESGESLTGSSRQSD